MGISPDDYLRGCVREIQADVKAARLDLDMQLDAESTMFGQIQRLPDLPRYLPP